MMQAFKQPLVQFLIGGFALFVLLSVVGTEPEEDGSNIVVTEPALLTFLQFQDKAFDEAQAKALFDALDDQARQRLVDEYVRDQVMVREAISLGLDDNDDVIRQRLIQKMDFLFQGFADSMAQPTEEEQRAFYEKFAGRYEQPAVATFTHVFFNARSRPDGQARIDAVSILAQLQNENVSFEDAGKFGDRFFFLRNYVERSEQLIEDHFGPNMTAEIFADDPVAGWFGPVTSKYGEHLVLLRARRAVRRLTFEEAQPQVLDDVLIERRNKVRRKAYEERAQNYSVDISALGKD